MSELNRRFGLKLIRLALTVNLLPQTQYGGPSRRHALSTASLAFGAGVIAAFPLYGMFPWYDLLAHAVGGLAVAAMLTLVIANVIGIVTGVTGVAVGWELIERSISLQALHIHMPTGDWRSDIVATVFGGVLFVVVGYVGRTMQGEA